MGSTRGSDVGSSANDVLEMSVGCVSVFGLRWYWWGVGGCLRPGSGRVW